MSCSRTTKFNATVHLTMKCIEEMKQTLMKNIQVLIFSFLAPSVSCTSLEEAPAPKGTIRY